MTIKLYIKKLTIIRSSLNGEYIHTTRVFEFHNPIPDYSNEEMNQLSKCC